MTLNKDQDKFLPTSLIYSSFNRTNEEQIIHGYSIDGAMVKGGCGSKRWIASVRTLLLREASGLLNCIVGHPNFSSAPSILLVLLEPYWFETCYAINTIYEHSSLLRTGSVGGPARHRV